MCPWQVIYRSSLERQMPNSGAVFQKLFKTIELCEPMFQSVVVLYRNKVCVMCAVAAVLRLQSCEPNTPLLHDIAWWKGGESRNLARLRTPQTCISCQGRL